MKTKKPQLFEWQKTYTQDGDTWSSQDQIMIVKQHTVSGGSGDDYYWTIETERWAFDTIEELVDVLKAAGVEQ